MAVTTTTLKLYYPEFTEVAEGRLQFAINKAIAIDSYSTKWSSEVIWEFAIYALAAHDLAIGDQQRLTLAGALALVENNDQGKFNKYENYYTLTPYGQDYYQLKLENTGVTMQVI